MIISLHRGQVFGAILAIFLVVGVAFVAASLDPTIPNPGHSVNELQKCGANEVLKMKSDGSGWDCAAYGSGGGFANPAVGSLDMNGFSVLNVGEIRAGGTLHIGRSSPNDVTIKDSSTAGSVIIGSGNGANVPLYVSQMIDLNNNAYYLDPNGNSLLSNLQISGTMQASAYTDKENVNYYLDPSANSYLSQVNVEHLYATRIDAEQLYDWNDNNYLIDPSASSRVWNLNVTRDFFAPALYDSNDPTNYFVNPNSVSILDSVNIKSLSAGPFIGTPHTFNDVAVYSNGRIHLSTYVSSAQSYTMELFVWDNSGCNTQGTSLGCIPNGGSSQRCLCALGFVN